jgi:ribosomal protein S18 acetylase RimI-like enzyme
LEQLTALDVRAFLGSPDESLVAESFEEDRRVLSEILEGLLGRFLAEASRALVTENGELVAALLTGEQTSRSGVYLDLIVDPAYRKRGLATYLARWGFRALLALGYESVRLWVTESNLPARHLYEALGFLKIDQALIFRWDRPGPPNLSPSVDREPS